MVKKIQITVSVSEIGDTNDYVIPADMKISDVISLIVQMSFPASHPAFSRLDSFKFFDADREVFCGRDKTAEECGISRGTKLLLI
jgi:hypothetical protein